MRNECGKNGDRKLIFSDESMFNCDFNTCKSASRDASANASSDASADSHNDIAIIKLSKAWFEIQAIMDELDKAAVASRQLDLFPSSEFFEIAEAISTAVAALPSKGHAAFESKMRILSEVMPSATDEAFSRQEFPREFMSEAQRKLHDSVMTDALRRARTA